MIMNINKAACMFTTSIYDILKFFTLQKDCVNVTLPLFASYQSEKFAFMSKKGVIHAEAAEHDHSHTLEFYFTRNL